MLHIETGEVEIVFQRSCCWWNCIPSVCPLHLRLFVSTLFPAVEEALTERAAPLRPSCYSSSLSSNNCLVCHSSLLQCIRFILPLSHAHPPSFCPPPSLLCLPHSLALSHTWRESVGDRIQIGCLPKRHDCAPWIWWFFFLGSVRWWME